MRIVWDEPKRLATLRARGLDFADMTPEFLDAAVVRPTRDGRYLAVGLLDGQTVAVVIRPLGREATSIISMRPASRKERRLL